MRITELFNLNKSQAEIDFVNIDPDTDTSLFVDPHLLGRRQDRWSIDATRTLRSFFHDIADLDLKNSININNPEFISLLYDLCASLIMLSLTILYYKIYQNNRKSEILSELNDFINIKKMVSLSMILILLLLSISSLFIWGVEMVNALNTNQNYPNPNTVFYADFFSIMIFVDVLLLIISFIYHFSFFTIFRNASFIITTILIRMSLTIEKPMNYIIILIGFSFSIITFYLYSLRKTNK